MCDVIANYIKLNDDYKGIILNGDFSGDNYVMQTHKLLKKRIKSAKKFKGIRKKLEPQEYSIDNLELALLNQEKQLMSNKEIIGYSHEDYLEDILTSFVNTNKEVYANPGVMERCNEYSLLLDDFTSKHSNIIDTTKHTKITNNNHDLVFVPGVLSEYFDEEGKFLIEKSYDSKIIPSTTEDDLEITSIFGLQTLANTIKRPENTVLFTSHPPKFKTIQGIDIYRQWELQNTVYLPFFENNIVIFEKYNQGDILDESKAYTLQTYCDAKLTPAFQNVGDDFLRMFYKSLGIQKIVANTPDTTCMVNHDWNEIPINHGTYNNELICSPSDMDKLIAGEIEIKDNKASYKPILFKNLQFDN